LFGHYQQRVATPDRVQVMGGRRKIRLFWDHIKILECAGGRLVKRGSEPGFNSPGNVAAKTEKRSSENLENSTDLVDVYSPVSL
jgi:hypothetical protein